MSRTLASVILRDTIANRPAAGGNGIRLFYATDTATLYRDNGATWETYSGTPPSVQIGGAPVTPFNGLYVGPNESTLAAYLQAYLTPGVTSGFFTGINALDNVPVHTVASQSSAPHNDVASYALMYYTGAGEGYAHEADLLLAANSIGWAQVGYVEIDGAGTAAQRAVDFYAMGTGSDGLGNTLGTHVSFWSDEQTLATNNYYSWFDSRGVRRVKEDPTVDGGLGQAIEALYNPRFAKYAPGAVDFERVVLGQWNANVAEIGTQAGGAGTARPLRLIGPSVSATGPFSAPSVTTNALTVATLPAAPAAGQRAFVSDATLAMAANFGAAAVGGGANGVPVVYDGAAWRIG